MIENTAPKPPPAIQLIEEVQEAWYELVRNKILKGIGPKDAQRMVDALHLPLADTLVLGARDPYDPNQDPVSVRLAVLWQLEAAHSGTVEHVREVLQAFANHTVVEVPLDDGKLN